MAPATLPRELCRSPALAPHCDDLPSTFGGARNDDFFADMAALVLIGGSLAAIAWADARRFLIPPPALGVLLAGGLLWQVAGTGQDTVSGSWAGPLAGR